MCHEFRHISDDRLHQLGEIYTANPALRLRGVSFVTFCQAPAEILDAVLLTPSRPQSDGFLPLLPAQEWTSAQWLAQAGWDCDNTDTLGLEFAPPRCPGRPLELRDGRLIQPIPNHRHHGSRHARTWGALLSRVIRRLRGRVPA
jgi:hypothetical protein